MRIRVEPESPIPIYHQIATAIRAQILSDEIAPGSYLVPMRQAAAMWGVHLHTVRHAYTELAREGLVESRRALGTQVQVPVRAGQGLESFLHQVTREAESRFGITPAGLLTILQKQVGAEDGGRPTIYVIECSESQCADLAQQIEAEWEIRALPWSLERKDEPPAGTLIATYFHYNEIRTRWPHLLRSTQFLTIQPDPGLFETLSKLCRAKASGKEKPTAVLYELDQPTLDAVASDLSILPGAKNWRIKRRLVASPEEAARYPDRPGLFPPRVWAHLPGNEQRSADCFEVRYVFNRSELERLARQRLWQSTRRSLQGKRENRPLRRSPETSS